MKFFGEIRRKGISRIFAEVMKGKGKPITAELSGEKNEWLMQWIPNVNDYRINDDPTLEAAGTKDFAVVYDIYREMLIKCPHFRHLIEKRKRAVLSKDLNIIPFSKDAEDIRISEACDLELKSIDGLFEDLMEVMDAIVYGFHVSEIMWTVKQTHDGIRWGIKELKARDHARFRFDFENNLLVDNEGTRTNFVKVPDNKFIIHQYNMEYENPYGQGEGRFNYWYYWFLKNGVKFWSIFIDKFAQPLIVGKHPYNAPEPDKEILKKVVEAFQTDQAVRIPDTLMIEFLEATRTGSITSYRDFVSYLETAMSKNVLLSAISSEQKVFRTVAQAEMYAGLRYETTESDAKRLEDVIRNQILRPFVFYNFGVDKNVPFVEFDLNATEDMRRRAETYKMLIQDLGMSIDRKFLHDVFNVPIGKGEGVESMGESQEGSIPVMHGIGRKGLTLSVRNAEGGMQGQTRREGNQPGESDPVRQMSFQENKKNLERIGSRWTLDLGRYIENSIDEGKRFYFKVMEWIREAVDSAEEPEQIYALNTELAESETQMLADFLTSAMFTAWGNGAGEIVRMGEDAGVEFGDPPSQSTAMEDERLRRTGGIMNFQEIEYQFTPLVPEDAVEYFSELLPMTKEELEGQLAEIRLVAFTVSDIQRKSVIRNIQERLTKAIAEGQTFEQWKKGTAAMFKAEGVSPFGNHRMRTIFETNIHKAIIQGRDRQSQDLVDRGILKYGMWQTAGDNRVRDDHVDFDGQVWLWTDPRWIRLNDYNCRCNKIPVIGG